MKNFIKELLPYVIIILIVVILRTYIITPVIVSGDSMKPNLQNKELLLVQKIGYNENSMKRFDIVVVENEGEEIIKRIIGMPGEHVSYKNNKLYINDKEVKEPFTAKDTNDFNLEEVCTCTSIPEGKYLVLGDNRPLSKDSRTIGLIDAENIKGKAIIRFWPLSKVGSIYNK